MTIRFKCPHCGTRTSVGSEYAGQVSSCAQCGRFTIVPNQGGMPPPVQAATASNDVAFMGPVAERRPWHPFWQFLAFSGIVLGIIGLFFLPGAYRIIFSRAESDVHMGPVDQYDPSSMGWPCPYSLRQIHVALSRYHDQYQCLPPAYTTDEQGRPMHSWRVLILPFLDQQLLYDQFRIDEPWDSPHNIALLDDMPRVYACSYRDVASGLSNFAVIIGHEGESSETLFAPNQGVRLEDIAKALDETILVAEVARGVPWTMPTGDLELQSMTMQINAGPASISSLHGRWANVLFADGQLGQVHDYTDPARLRQMLLAN